MTCTHFGTCGSCTLYALDYESQIAKKLTETRELFDSFYCGEYEFFKSQEEAYRCRAEFKVYKDDSGISLCKSSFEKKNLPINECKIPLESIQESAKAILEKIEKNEILRYKLYGIEFLSSKSGELLITLIYHKKLDTEWESEAKSLGENIIGRSKGQKIILGKDYIEESFEVLGERFYYTLKDGSFIQPNPRINEKMLEWVCDRAANQSGDLLELYCGHGNFTIPLARRFKKVLATEISTASIRSAKENCIKNSAHNIFFARLSGSETISALQHEREFKRLKEINLQEYDFSALFVDPPRAGLEEEVCGYIKRFPTIIYISCSQESLRRDLQTLIKTHEITHFALFDQFPHTEHIESGVILKKRV